MGGACQGNLSAAPEKLRFVVKKQKIHNHNDANAQRFVALTSLEGLERISLSCESAFAEELRGGGRALLILVTSPIQLRKSPRC